MSSFSLASWCKQHCVSIDKAAFEMTERVRADYLKVHPMSKEDTLGRIRISTQAQMIADKIILSELICI